MITIRNCLIKGEPDAPMASIRATKDSNVVVENCVFEGKLSLGMIPQSAED